MFEQKYNQTENGDEKGFDETIKNFTTTESQTDMPRAVVLGTLLYNLCDKPLLIKTSSGGYDV